MGRKWNLGLISGGNEQQFKQQARALTDLSTSDSKHRWMWLMNYLQWYTHSFIFEGDEELEYLKPFIAEKLFWTGYCGVTEFAGEKIVVELKNVKIGLDGYIHSAEVGSFGSRYVTDKLDMKKKLTRDNTAFFQGNIYRWPMFIGLDELISPILDIWRIIPLELQNAVTKLIFKINTDDVKQRDTMLREIESMMKKDGRLIQVVNSKLGEHIELKSETITEKLQDAIKFWKNYGYQMTGRLFNASEKRDRNLQSEVSVNTLQFTVVRNDYLGYLSSGVKMYNDVFNTSIIVKPLQEVEEDKAMERQMMTMTHGANGDEKGNEKDENDK